MKQILWILGLGLISSSLALAQVRVELEIDQEQFLPNEPLLVGVRVINQSGQTLRMGEDDQWLRFVVETRHGKLVSQLKEVPVRKPFSVESAKIAMPVFNLAPYFALNVPGRFKVTAIIKITQWNQVVDSSPQEFDIIKGFKLWEQDFGVPAPPQADNQPPEVRKYILQKADYMKQTQLYMRIADRQDHHVFAVFSLGPMVSFGRPEHQLDKRSCLHVLWQAGARSFTYCVVNPNGKVILRQRYDHTNTRPTLYPDGEGGIKVKGGIRMLSPYDLPSALPSAPTSTDAISPPS